MKIPFPIRFLLLSLVVSACLSAEEGGDPEPTGDEQRSVSIDDCEVQLAGGIATDGCRENGKFLFGRNIDGIAPGSPDHLNVSTTGTKDGQTVFITFTGNASLVGVSPSTGRTYAGPDPWFSGVVLTASDGGTITLRNPSGDALVTDYELEYQKGKAPMRLLCGLDEQGARARAIPFFGTFSRRGLHEPKAERLSFACATAAAEKCARWGYMPGANTAAGSRWHAHQACTRMVRFDVCANGVSHTRQETPIGVYDSIPGASPPPPFVFPTIDEWPPPADVFYFEAAWRGGAEPALCFTKGRWESLPIGGFADCAGALPDPRLREDPNGPARYCEEYEWEGPDDDPGTIQVPAPRPLLFSTSPYMDLGLHHWSHPRQGTVPDQIATVRGFHRFNLFGDPADRTRQPFGGYSYGGLDAILLRARTGTVEEDEVTPVGIWYNEGTGDRVIAPVEQPEYLHSGYELEHADEGLVFKEERGPTTIPLLIYKHPTEDDLISTTPARSPEGYQPLDGIPIGWVIAPGQ